MDVDARWRDLDHEVGLHAAAIEARFGGPLDAAGAEAVQVVRPLFFRNKAAYLVGRVLAGSGIVPLVLALTHPPGGVTVDAVLLDADEAARCSASRAPTSTSTYASRSRRCAS